MKTYAITFMSPDIVGRERKSCVGHVLLAILALGVAILAVGCVAETASAAVEGRPFQRQSVVTAYNSVAWQTDSTPCISADGSDICALKAVDDHSCAAALPFGTRIWIPGYGLCTVRDRLARKYSGRIDVHFGGAEHVKDARKWGKRNLTVWVF